MSFYFLKIVGGAAQEGRELLDGGALVLALHRYGVANGDMHLPAVGAHHLPGEAQAAQAPVDYAEQVEYPGVMAVEENRDHGHLELLYEADDRRLPFAVAHGERPVELRHGSGGEEAEGVPLLHMLHGLAYALHGDLLLLRIVALEGIDGYEVLAHCLDLVEDEVDHHLEVGTELSDDVEQEYAVVASEGVVADGDEGAVLESGESLEIVYAEVELELILYQAVGELHAWSVAIGAVDAIYLVEAQEMHDVLHQFPMAVESGQHLADIVVSYHFRTDLRGVCVRIFVVHMVRP